MNGQLRILYVAHDTSMYGSNQSLFYLLCELCKKYPIDPVVLVPGAGDFTQYLEESGIKYIAIKYSLWQAVYKSRFRFWGKSVLRYAENVLGWRQVKRKIKDKRFDLVHSNSSVVEIGARCATYMDVPHVWHIREYGLEDWSMKYMYPIGYVKKEYAKAEALISVSKGIEKKFKNEFPGCRISTIYDGILPAKFVSETGNKGNVIRFCQVGYISEAKNQIAVLEACKILKEKYTADFSMNFIGSGQDEYYRSFLKYIENNGLESQVKVWGFQKDIGKMLKKMDVGIISSRMEGFGRVTVEFMMMGMPVIGYASGGTLELVRNGENGFLYHTAEELAGYMYYFIQKESRIEEMGKKGRIWAETEFTAERNADLIYHTYRQILEKHTGGL